MSTMLPAKRTPVIVYKNAPGSFYDSILVSGRIQDMTGATILFFMRPLESRVPTINGSAGVPITPPDKNGNNVRFDWNSSQLTEGDYMAWWNFTLIGSGAVETPEFPILVTDHGPGLGTQTGSIVDGVAAFMPISLNALRNDDRFGDQWLQQQAEVMKWRVLGYTMSPDQESSLHIVLQDFLSKRLALQLTKPAIEYWSRQQRTVTTTQTSEVISYPDMIASLKELASRLVLELTSEWRDLLTIVPGLPQQRVLPMPASSLGDPNDPSNPNADYVTANPQAAQRLLTGGRGWGIEIGAWPFP